MKWNHLGRTLLCLLLVCVLLFNISPIRADAVTLGGIAGAVAIGVGTVIFVGAALNALGVSAGSDPFEFEDIAAYLADEIDVKYELNGTVPGYVHAIDGQRRTYFPAAIMQELIDILFRNAFLARNLGYSDLKSYSESPWGACTLSASFPFNVVYFSKGTQYGYVVYSQTKGTVYGKRENGSTFTLPLSAYNSYYYMASWCTGTQRPSLWSIQYLGDTSTVKPYESNANNLAKYFLDTVIPGVVGEVETPFDLTLGDVNEDLMNGYPAYAGTALPDNATSLYLPLTIPSANSVVANQRQDDAQTGLTSQEVIDVFIGVGFEDGNNPNEPDKEENQFYPMDPNYTTLIERLFGNVSDKIEYVAHSIQEIPDLIREFALDVKKGFEELPTKFAEWFNDIRTKLQQLVNGQITLADLLAGLFEPIRNAVVDALTYLFAPRETFIKDQVETLIAKYPTSNNLFMLGTRLGDFLLNLGQTPPVIYIDLGAAEGSLLLGGTVAFLDLTWYARYKGTVDSILGAFLWLLFAWRVWLKLPGIIGGASGTIGSILSRKEDFNDN